ncbi:Sec1 family protein [Coccidioides posadasii C735 delta SOWgp]|uniref:Sec1 family protein n=1 Tax=Coccidioides posadasii (strain C735) TaxID=222929 RepID=C5PI31_COCP7|nr:Sec1 family protein [Coccidioides posadasii C735 delta SOWgp]EER24184.1 Sec1 family protein [Coccidioides posadasii C735 delta SOWgp]|eukprot:XP_003066329.1 Sec1 family protein [Coccidioides posadasii C735 delta SOWgp]
MDSSLIEVQRKIILDTVRYTAEREWKVLVVDALSKKLIDNAVKEDDILNANVTNIEQIEHRRPMNQETDAVYFLSPLPHIVDSLIADLQRRRYRRAFLVWTARLDPQLRSRINGLSMARDLIADFRIVNINYFPRESHLVIFRDPWSFPTLFHPACNNLVRGHLEDLAQRIVSVCVSLGEYPVIRYYRPKAPTHEASVLCSHLARFVQDELDAYAKSREDFPTASRQRGLLYIVDRTLDLVAPLVHEFTYQAMAHDLLPIKEGEKVTYETTINAGEPNQETKELEISENDSIWVESRHLHMKDLLGKLVDDFNQFRAKNPQFADNDSSANVNTIRDMLAGLSKFQEGKNSYTLHLNMAEECMQLFQDRNLPELASVEQSLGTGLDEDYRKPKNLADQLVRLLDDERVRPPDRLRLIVLYLLYRGGLLGGDIKKLLAHSQLPPQDGEVIYNFDLLGARVEKPLSDTKPPNQPLFARKPPAQINEDDTSLSRFEPNLKLMLQEQIRGTLDTSVFPSTRPHADGDDVMSQDNVSQASLRSAKPTWARIRPSAAEPRQKIIVFMAGGATYSEARSCYELSQNHNKDIYLVTSHMLTPGLFLRQVGDLSVDKRRLNLPADQPKPQAPRHLFEREPSPKPQVQPQPQPQPLTASKSLAPPTSGLAAMTMSSQDDPRRVKSLGESAPPRPQPMLSKSEQKLSKKDKDKKDKEKKKRFFK